MRLLNSVNELINPLQLTLKILMNGHVKVNLGYEREAAHLMAAEPEVLYGKVNRTSNKTSE